MSRSRTLPAPPKEVWRLVSDPNQLPRWWPGVERVEDATPSAWTTVTISSRGRAVRADFTRTEERPPARLAWRQELEESPFERVFAEARTELSLEPEGAAETRARLKTVQRLRGRSRYGGFIARRAARRQLGRALDGLERALREVDPA